MMQRQSSSAKFTISFLYQTKHSIEEITEEEIIFEDIATPEEFAKNYRELCELTDKLPKDLYKTFHSQPYTIKITGTLNGREIDKTFSNIDKYHALLTSHKLLPDPATRPRVSF